jgi:tetratricopeptide (TPR) repeat protein
MIGGGGAGHPRDFLQVRALAASPPPLQIGVRLAYYGIVFLFALAHRADGRAGHNYLDICECGRRNIPVLVGLLDPLHQLGSCPVPHRHPMTKSPDVRQVGRELGTRYVLEGSVRKAASRVRITGQLIDATTGAHLWADRFEGNLTDIFELQDQVTISVVGAIAPKIRGAEIERALHKSTENLPAYDLVLRGRWADDLNQRDSMEVAADFFRRAIVLDPNYAVAYALLAKTLWITAAFQWTKPCERELSEYVELAKTAIKLGQADPEALAIAAYIVGLPGGELEEGIAIMDRAIAQNPNSADALAMSGTLRAYLGDTQTAFLHLKMAERMAPLDVHVMFKDFGFYLAAFVDGDYAGAIDGTAKALRKSPANVTALRYRVSALALASRLDDARRTVAQLLTVLPEMTIARCRRHVEVEMKNPFKRPGVADAYYRGLRLAGLPE